MRRWDSWVPLYLPKVSNTGMNIMHKDFKIMKENAEVKGN
jgi:hypothetical protein